MIKDTNDFLFQGIEIKKYYGATKANDGISFDLKPGEIRGLAGENGSGKSTLISIISGITKRESGEMYVCGKKYNPNSPLDAHEFQIGTVVQELGLVDGLTVGMNIFLGQTAQFTKFGILNLNKLYEEAEQLFVKWGFSDINVKAMTGSLSVEMKKIVELMRALTVNPKLLILDEITQSLSHNNRENLYKLIKKVSDNGTSVIIITHDMDEMLTITDSISVLLDGKFVGTYSSNQITLDELKLKMVGRKIDDTNFRENTEQTISDDIVLSVSSLTGEGFDDVTFDLHQGEILGLSGLSDGGIHELGEAIYGVRPSISGDVKLVKNNHIIKNLQDSLNNSISYLPKDRDKNSLMVNDSINNNISLAIIDKLEKKFGYIDWKKSKEFSREVMQDYQVKANNDEQTIRGLSGGNRQKISLGRWLVLDNDILILDSPTRGVDIGVKAYIYSLLNSLKEKNKSIIIISDELPELIGMCDTIYVMKNGKITAKVQRGPDMSEETLIKEMI